MNPYDQQSDPDLHFSQIHWPGAKKRIISAPMRLVNKVLTKISAPVWLVPRFDHREEMVSTEQVVNFQHLIGRVLDARTPGAFVELGCYTGNTTAIIGTILKGCGASRELHVYDNFAYNLSKSKLDILGKFVENMKRQKLELPHIHRGDLMELIPNELPEKIAFVHLDLGVGGDPESHKKFIVHCLEGVYDRMSHGAIGVLMDYYEEGVTVSGANVNPGVRAACDEFFKGRPEKMYTLYGGPCSHGYFRKH